MPVLHRSGPVVLEQWVDGVPWDAVERSADDIRSAATLLGAVHQVRRAAGQELPYLAPTTDVIAMNQGNLALLTATGALSTQQQSALQPKLAAAPPAAVHGLLHTDFCPENIVRSSDGTLWVVDNEHLRVGAVDMDLAPFVGALGPQRPWSDAQQGRSGTCSPPPMSKPATLPGFVCGTGNRRPHRPSGILAAFGADARRRGTGQGGAEFARCNERPRLSAQRRRSDHMTRAAVFTIPGDGHLRTTLPIATGW